MEIQHKVCIVGCGNISNTRHIPALIKTGRVDIVGAIGKNDEDILKTSRKWRIPHCHTFTSAEELEKLTWLHEVDFVVMGIPPQEHYPMVKAFLKLKKHVLIEKPFVLSPEQATDLIDFAAKQGVHLFVMHNFQFTSAFTRLEKYIRQGKIGEIESYFEFQFTNNTRRLPHWHNDLPLGLFFDEAAHFLYLLERLEGDIEILDSHAFRRTDPSENTPQVISVAMRAGKIPVNLMINFNSPICEWYFIVFGKKQIALFDFFRDILITIPNDGQHLSMDVISNSWNFTFQHWWGTFINGIKMMSGNLLYGTDRVMNLALDDLDGKAPAGEIDAQRGLLNIKTLDAIIHRTRYL